MSNVHAANCSCSVCIAKKNNSSESCSMDAGHDHEEDCGCGHEHTGAFKKYPVRLIIGAVMFVAAILISNLTAIPQWGSLILFLAAYLVLGANVLIAAGRNITKGQVFDENFLMSIATIGAFVVGEYMEGAAVMLFYLIGETLSDAAVERSRRSITELMDIRPDTANIERDGKIIEVSPEDIAVGDIIVIRPYERVPLDAIVVEGHTSLDTSALTGESVPRDVETGGEVLSGFINGSGLIKARVERAYAQSTASKVLEIVEHASSRKAQTERFITKFARYYTPIVVAAALVVAIIPSLVTGAWSVWVYRALLFLVISCPCALVVAVPLSYFGGIGGASRKGILIKGANYIDVLADVSEVVFDKTGTLTKGVFEVEKIGPQPEYTEDELLAAAAAAESNSSHPIALSILREYENRDGSKIDQSAIENYKDIAGHGVSAEYEGDHILAGSGRLMRKENVTYEPVEAAGTILYLAINGEYMGYVVIADSLKDDAKTGLAELNKLGISTGMLTGDTQYIADRIAAEAGINDVRAELLPQDKVTAFEQIAAETEDSKRVAFVGDGINDAPVLARADVGIAMGALGSDAAIEAADVVLMTDEIKKAPLAVRISRKTKRIVWQNIIFALAVKVVVMVLGVAGFANMWAAVFADVGVTLLAVLNALRALKAPESK